MNKNWIGNKNSIYKTLGASSHSKEDREIFDYYATQPEAAKFLLDLENFHKNILEPACGEGHLSNVLENKYNVLSSDIIFRNKGYKKNFFDYDFWEGDIVTNPPYKYAQDFIEHSLKIIPEGNKVAMFLKLQFMEGKKRKNFFLSNPPIRIWVSSSRIKCAKNGIFEEVKSSAVAYGWFIWIKGNKNKPIIDWFN